MAPLELPTLRDGDLILRPKRTEDADAVTAACQDPEIPRWTMVPSPYTRRHAEEHLATVAERARRGESVDLHAVDPDGALLGAFSLMALDRAPGQGEIGYWVAAEARGRGVATRAVRLLTEWGHRELGLERIELMAHDDNLASRAVAERAGYAREPGLHPSPRIGVHEPVFVRYVSRGR